MTDDLDAFGEAAVRVRSSARADEPESEEAPAQRLPMAMVFVSASSGYPHVVGVVDEPRFLRLTCTCKAYLSIDRNPDGCWAMKRARVMLGEVREEE